MSGPAPRRSREERTSDSRARILDAAVACLVDGGYAGATTLRIQARAGVSRGRLLHHFPSRELLLVAAAQHVAEVRVQATEERVMRELAELGDAAGPAARCDRVVELLWAPFHEAHYLAATELWVAARSHPEIADALRPAERRIGAVIRASAERMFGAPHAQHPRFAALRELLVTSMRGTALTYSFERRDPATDPHLRTWQKLARTMLEIPADPTG